MTTYLHVGTHKTGTTAIQHFAADRRSELRKLGIWYPLYQDVGLAPAHYAHHHLSHAIASDDAAKLSSARLFCERIEAARRPGETVLISAEPIYRHLYPLEGEYWASRDGYISRLRSFFPGDDVVIVLVIRRQDQFATSLFQERVKAKRFDEAFDSFLVTQRDAFLYRQQLDVFTRHFPRQKVLVFEDIAGVDLIDNFFRALGIDTSRTTKPAPTNVGLPIPLVEFKRLLNGTNLSSQYMSLVPRALEQLRHEYGSKAEWWSNDARAEFLASFEADNTRLRQQYLTEREGPLFPPMKRADPEIVFAGLSAQDVATIAARMIPLLGPKHYAAPNLRTRLRNWLSALRDITRGLRRKARIR